MPFLMLCNFSGHVNALFDFFCINDVVALFFMWPCAYGFLFQKAHLMCVASMSQNRSIEVMPVISCPSPIYDALRKSLLQKFLPNPFGRLCPWRGRPSADEQSAALSITVACIILWCLTGAKVMLPKQRHAVRWGFHFGSWFQHIPRIPWKDLIS